MLGKISRATIERGAIVRFDGGYSGWREGGWLTIKTGNDTTAQWEAGRIEGDRYYVKIQGLEAWLVRVNDTAMRLEMDERVAKLLGY